MHPAAFSRLAGRLMRQAAAPYFEHAVRAEAEMICAEFGLRCRRDRFGNLIVELKRGRPVLPVVLAAHLDHPGFEIVKTLSTTRWLARFCGGVPTEYFRAGIPVRLLPGYTPAKIRRSQGERLFEMVARQSPGASPKFAVWDLPDFSVRSGRIHGRACDDLVGAAAVLATLRELSRAKQPCHAIGLLSRAEEVGFRGALALACGRAIPKRSLVISLETSRELPGAKMGNGVILRVGDRTSIFDSAATRFLEGVARALQARRKGFGFQRALMSGGTCEGTAYQAYGFQTAAVCVALGNYHNCAPGRRIAAEYVDLQDACAMVELLVSTCQATGSFRKIVEQLPTRLEQLRRESAQRLRETAGDG